MSPVAAFDCQALLGSHVTDGIVLFRHDKACWLNESAREKLGYVDGDVRIALPDFCPDSDLIGVAPGRCHFWRHVFDESLQAHRRTLFLAEAKTIESDNGAALIFQDISRILAYETMVLNSTMDAESGLLSQTGLQKLGEDCISRRKTRQTNAMLYIQIDDLDQCMRDQLVRSGVIRELAKRLHNAVRGGDLAAHVGTGTFSVLLTGIEDPRQAMPAARRVGKAIAAPFHHRGSWIRLATRVGVALQDTDGATLQELQAAAEIAARGAVGVLSHDMFIVRFADQGLQQEARAEEARRARARQMVEEASVPIVTAQYASADNEAALIRIASGEAEEGYIWREAARRGAIGSLIDEMVGAAAGSANDVVAFVCPADAQRMLNNACALKLAGNARMRYIRLPMGSDGAGEALLYDGERSIASISRAGVRAIFVPKDLQRDGLLMKELSLASGGMEVFYEV